MPWDFAFNGHGMGLEDPDRVTGPHHGSDVVRLMDVLHKDSQVGLTGRQYASQLPEPFGRHELLKSDGFI